MWASQPRLWGWGMEVTTTSRNILHSSYFTALPLPQPLSPVKLTTANRSTQCVPLVGLHKPYQTLIFHSLASLDSGVPTPTQPFCKVLIPRMQRQPLAGRAAWRPAHLYHTAFIDGGLNSKWRRRSLTLGRVSLRPSHLPSAQFPLLMPPTPQVPGLSYCEQTSGSARVTIPIRT